MKKIELKKLTPEQQKQILSGILAALGLIVWVGFLIVPMRRGLTERRGRIEELEIQIGQVTQGLSQLPRVEEEIQRLIQENQLPAAPRSIEEQLPDLLNSISKMAASSQVRLASLKPTAKLDTLAPGLSGYVELPLLLTALGGYHEIGRFLDQLEESAELIRVSGLEISPHSEDIWHHDLRLHLTAYLLPGSLPEEP